MKFKTPLLFSITFTAFLFLIPQLPSETKVIFGEHVIVYDIIKPGGIKFIPEYKNESFEQKILEKYSYGAKVQITSKISDNLNLSWQFPTDLRGEFSSFLKAEKDFPSDNKEIIALGRNITKNISDYFQVVDAISNWLIDNLTYSTETSQVASDVLKNKKGSCLGQTRLMISLLRSLGIPARYVRGYLPPNTNWGWTKKLFGVDLKTGGFHAWVEIYYPDKGWIFTDILHSKYYSDPYHIIFDIVDSGLNSDYTFTATTRDKNEIAFEKGVSFTVVEEKNRVELIDIIKENKNQRTSRKINNTQNYFTVKGDVYCGPETNTLSGNVILKNKEKGKILEIDRNSFIFIGLSEGNYNLDFLVKECDYKSIPLILKGKPSISQLKVTLSKTKKKN